MNVQTLALGIALAMSSGAVLADQTCTCESAGDDAVETILEVDTTEGKHLKLRFEAEPITTHADKAYLCIDPATAITRAKLWMPDMGHGSGPTRLSSNVEGCTVVDRIGFLMAGAWELQVTLSDGDAGTFAVAVAED